MNELFNRTWILTLTQIKPTSQEVIFSRNLKTVFHPSITSNNNPLSLCLIQSQLRLVLDSKLTFNDHIKHILPKVKKSRGLLRKYQPVLSKSSLANIYETFIPSHLNYADVVYVQIYSSSFHKKLELIQYNAALAKSCFEKLYQELDVDCL